MLIYVYELTQHTLISRCFHLLQTESSPLTFTWASATVFDIWMKVTSEIDSTYQNTHTNYVSYIILGQVILK